MNKHLGIVGVSHEGVALFYRLVTRHASRVLPENAQPHISVHNEPLRAYIEAIRKDDWHLVGKLLRRSADLLARCGAQFCLTPDNAVQHGVQLAEVGSPIPWLTIPDLVGEAIACDKRKKVGIVGTKLVMLSSTYQTHLGMRGIHVHAPSHAQCDAIDRIIFEELIYGYARPESAAVFHDVVASLGDAGCEAVIIASSEIPLVLRSDTSSLPLYDSGDILAHAAVKKLAG